MAERTEWNDTAAGHIRTRSTRYDGAVDIDPGWTRQVVTDPDRLVDEPDPKSAHANSVRAVGTRRPRAWSSPSWRYVTVMAYCAVPPPEKSEAPRYASMWKAETMSDITDQELRNYRDQAETTRDEPLSAAATRPGWQRAKVLSVRLSEDEFEELSRYATALELPASGLVRGWILDQLRAGSDSPVGTVDRISHELEQLRRQLTV